MGEKGLWYSWDLVLRNHAVADQVGKTPALYAVMNWPNSLDLRIQLSGYFCVFCLHKSKAFYFFWHRGTFRLLKYLIRPT